LTLLSSVAAKSSCLSHFGGWNQNRLEPSFFFLCRPLLADWKSSMIVASGVFKTWQIILDDCRCWRRWDKMYNWSGMSNWDWSDEGGFESFSNELSRAEDETHAFDYQDKKSNTLSSSDVKVGVVSKFLTSYFRSCDGLKNKLDKEVWRKCCLHWKCRDVRWSTSIFLMSSLFKKSNPDNHAKLIFQQVRNTFSVFL
jgi:hypothetical protein